MRKTGITFIVEGEYATDVDENGELIDWQPFETKDLRTDGKNSITIWSQLTAIDDQELADMVNRAVVVVDWLREERGWIGFDAGLYRQSTSECVFSWELR